MPYASMSFLPHEAQLLLDGELDRQAVAVPAGLAGHVVAAHGPEAGEHVLEDAGFDVVRAGHAVRGRRALVEHPLGASLGLLKGLREDLAVAPEVEHVVLQRGQVDLGGHLAVLRRCHRDSSGGLSSFRRRDESTAPAVPPSLAPGRHTCPEPPHWGRDAGSSHRALVRLSSDGSGVMLHIGLAPGLSPSPGRSWLRTTLLVPIQAFRCGQCTGRDGGRPTRFPEPPTATRMAIRSGAEFGYGHVGEARGG